MVWHHCLCRYRPNNDGGLVLITTIRPSREVSADGEGGINDRTACFVFHPAPWPRINNTSCDTFVLSFADAKLGIASKAHSTRGISPVAVATADFTVSLLVTERGEVVFTVAGDVVAATAPAVTFIVSAVTCSSSSPSKNSKKSERETHKRNVEKEKKKKRKRGMMKKL